MTLIMAMDSRATGEFYDEFTRKWVRLVNGRKVRNRKVRKSRK
jgi:hypothetical protein